MSQLRRTWLTRGAYDRLSRELAALVEGDDEGGEEPELAHGSEEARQARIARLQEILTNAVVEEIPPDDGIAEPGMVLTVRYEGDDEPETFLLGVRDGSAGETLPVYSPASPLGKAITGAERGEQRSFTAPNGRTVRVTLVDAEPYGKHQDHRGS